MKLLFLLLTFIFTQNTVLASNRKERIEACHVIASDDTFGYSCAILKKGEHYVFVLGESHLKGLWEKSQGRKFVDKFSLIGIEGLPPEECDADEEDEDQRRVASFDDLSRKRGLSDSIDVFASAALFGVAYTTFHDVFSENTQIVNFDDPEKARKTLKNYNSSSSKIVVALELGRRLKKPFLWYTDREERMSENINTVLSTKFSEPVDMLVVVGGKHAPGIYWWLTVKNKFDVISYKRDERRDKFEAMMQMSLAMWLVKLTVSTAAVTLITKHYYPNQHNLLSIFLFTRVLQESTEGLYYLFRSMKF